jgi:adenine-specific DNA-methyltransferase
MAIATTRGIDDTSRERLEGEVFTREWIVDLILDLAGYTEDQDLGVLLAVEPACGEGAFLGPMVRRLSRSCRAAGRSIADARHAIAASDLLADNVATARQRVTGILANEGWLARETAGLAEAWVTHRDYLLSQPSHLRLLSRDVLRSADFVIGNPPYVRPEDVPAPLYRTYRESYPTMCGRADVYVAFIEAGLRSLAPGGVLAFICADRWMRNQYGRELRGLVAADFAVETIVSLHDVDSFEEAVAAYPAVTVIRNAAQGPAAVIDTKRDFGESDARGMVAWASGRTALVAHPRYSGARLPRWFEGKDSWPGGDPDVIRMVEELKDRFPTIEDRETGTRVGIGIATGNDGVFITTDPDLVEEDRSLPLSMAADGATGTLAWSGHYLVNPWEESGKLVDLDRYPRLQRYLEAHQMELCRRHVAKRSVANWYRTIDKVNAELTAMPKLLFPDMKLTIHPVLDPGGLYPHHNLYFVISEKWDLEVLGGLLMSKVAEAFVSAYCVKMRGGTLRFQAQYLRRIRVPAPDSISADDREALRAAFAARDSRSATEIAVRLYGVENYRGVLDVD